jgi:hypothetical protein
MNVLTYFIKDDTTLWFFVPLIFWGVGLLIHYIQGVALFNDWWDSDARETRDLLTERRGGPKAKAAATE